MHRIQLIEGTAVLPHQSSAQRSTSRPEIGPHTLFAPMHYEANYAYPLLVWLHDEDDDESQLNGVMPTISYRNYVGVAPRAAELGNLDGPLAWEQNEAAIRNAARRVFDCTELAQTRYHIAPHRVFLAGCGRGGTMALRIGLEFPGHFAGALSLGGPFPSSCSPLARINQVRGLPIFLAQGRQSQVYAVEQACRELRLFHAAGMNVTIRQYPCGDELIAQMLRDMDAWMMELVTGGNSHADDDATRYPYDCN